jgi:hypothetical protein
VRIVLPLSLGLVCAASLHADWIELKDGTRIEGDISSVTSAAIVIEVQTTPSIREEKSYPRTGVAKFQRATQDDLAFAEITAMPLPANADSPAAYDTDLAKDIARFITSYPYSKHIGAARKLAAQIEAERARAAAGDVKIDGAWIPAAEWQSDKVDLAGRLQLAKMKQAPDPAAALAAFEVIERSHPTSSAYPEAVRLAREQTAALKTAVSRMRTELQRRLQQQSEGLTLASEDRRIVLQAGIDQEKAANQAKIDAAKKSGSKWPPLVADEKLFDELDRLAEAENTRLAAIDVATFEAAIAAANEASAKLDSGDTKGARESLEQAKKLWSQYNRLASLEENLKKAEAAASAAAATTGNTP